MSKVVANLKDVLKALWGLKVSIKDQDGREVAGPMLSYLLVIVGAVGVLRAVTHVYRRWVHMRLRAAFIRGL